VLPLAAIRRPLQRVLGEAKVAGLIESIAAEGQREPIDVLEVDGVPWGFNGCHRVAVHERLGRTTIRARVRRANREVLRMNLMQVVWARR
jgi:sulfiredoxin